MIKDYKRLNTHNIYTQDNVISADTNTIFILYINNNHFNFLQLLSNNKEEKNNKTIEIVYNLIKLNLNEWKNIKKREYLIVLHWSPVIFKYSRRCIYFIKLMNYLKLDLKIIL